MVLKLCTDNVFTLSWNLFLNLWIGKLKNASTTSYLTRLKLSRQQFSDFLGWSLQSNCFNFEQKYFPFHVLQGVTYSPKFWSQHGFSKLANGKTCQLMFLKYLIEYQNAKVMKWKFKIEKSNKNKHNRNVASKENKKKRN